MRGRAGGLLAAGRPVGLGACLAAVFAGLVAALPATASAAAQDDTLAAIQRRGVLVVGVKRDVPLWGQHDPASGAIVGLEPDLAADLARRAGVRLRLVPVLTAERLEALESRRVDLLVATLSDTADRRQRVRMVMPHYYASGASILARKSLALRDWEDLRHRRVCGRRGAFYNRPLTVSHGIDIVALYGNARAVAAMREGRCEALLYDDTIIAAMLSEPAWSAEFEMPLPSRFVVPWAIAVHRQDAGGRLEQLVSQAVIDWHRRGTVVALERKWGIPGSAYARAMNAVWNRRLPGGQAWCGDAVLAATPRECL